MDKETLMSLAQVRIERAEELLDEAKTLLNQDKYKSANNRAFYAIEKSIKAMLAIKGIDAESHNGCLQQFNVHFIRTNEAGFGDGDYKIIANARRIRNSSDYDDFYLADKAECVLQTETAENILKKAKNYINKNKSIGNNEYN